MSKSYERMNYITSFGFSIRWRRQSIGHLDGSLDNIKVIDLMTGMGEIWNPLKKKFPNASLTALDFSDEMLRHASLKNQKYFDNQILLVQKNFLNSDLPSDYFDLVTCSFGLKTFNTEQLHVLASETKRILKKGGDFSFIEVSKPTNPMLYMLYAFYLSKIIPVLGWLFLGNPREYKMLWKYTSIFKNADAAANIFEQYGLSVKSTSFFFGCASGFHGTKQ
jgi:ubiquinone/menaquinone biosynthesis methyltransferase